MTVVLAYIHTPEGDAALTVAVQEARARATNAVVVNVTRPVAEVESPLSAEQGLDAVAAVFQKGGVEVEVRQLPATVDRAGDIPDRAFGDPARDGRDRNAEAPAAE